MLSKIKTLNPTLSATALDFKAIDLHIHSTFSDGKDSLDTMINAIHQKQLQIFAITDHYSEFSNGWKRMGKADLESYLSVFEQLASVSIFERTDIIVGLEVDLIPSGPSISKGTRNMVDLTLGGLHELDGICFNHDYTKIKNPSAYVEKIRVTLIKAIESNLIDVIAHPTRLPENIKPKAKQLITRDWIESVVDAALDNDVAMEINATSRVPDKNFVSECLKTGVRISIGSDAHNRKEVGFTGYSTKILEELNTYPEAIYLP
jgi:HisJ family histidinol phosphate phosphatase